MRKSLSDHFTQNYNLLKTKEHPLHLSFMIKQPFKNELLIEYATGNSEIVLH